MNTKIAIRVDTNKEIATGHVMRCMSVAMELVKMEADVTIISADDGVCPFVGAEIRTYVLDSDWQDMESEIPRLIKYLKAEGIVKMLVDSYRVTKEYFTALADAGIEVTYLDDLCEYAYPVKAVINYRPDAESKDYEPLYAGSPDMPDFYLGAKYAPLREQFRTVGDADNLEIKEDCQDILVTTGGSDNLGISETIIRGILSERGIIHLLAGIYYEPTPFILDQISEGTVILHQNVSNVAEIMKQCKAAVSSAGSTLLELSAVGVPAVTFTLADNQMPNARYFDKAGLMPYAGDFRTEPEKCLLNINNYLGEVLNCPSDVYNEKRYRLQSFVEGQGAKRIATFLFTGGKV